MPEAREDLWATVQAAAKTMQGRPSLTLERSPHVAITNWAGELAQARDSGLALHDTLGEGGMGRVHRAQQPTLDREVAVKSLRPDRRTPELTAKILQEAWVLGRLDHPNIVPIHDIVIDARGDPQIVMKRVKGKPWNELLGELSVVEHLRIAQQVCNAVAYAHVQGLVHLDLKPENVMVGSFGEVYLMDWGIAMALDERSPRIPQLRSCDEIIGTPSYMAPEMLEANGEKLGRHTDIYLLGATLFHVVCGHPPHRGETMMTMLYDIVHRDPVVPDDVGPELADLLVRCLSRDPANRPPDAQDVSASIERALAAQESQRLSDEAAARLGELRALAAKDNADDSSEHEREIHDAFAAARFGFELALDRSPGHRAAHQGWLDATQTMARWELDHGRHEAAASLLAKAPELPQALRDAVQAGAAKARAEAARLEQFERDQNPLIGQRTRLFIAALMGALWTVLPLLAHFVLGLEPSGPAFRNLTFVFLGGLVALLVWARESISKTALNRNVAAGLVSVFVVQSLLVQTGVTVGLSGHLIISIATLLYCISATLFAVFSERNRRIGFSAVGYGAAFVCTLLWPDKLFPIVAAANFVFTVNVVAIWWSPIRGPTPA